MGLGRRLGPLEPRHLPLKKAWRTVIQATRDRKRRVGQTGPLSSLSEVERIRNRPLRSGVTTDDLSALKEALAAVYWASKGSLDSDQALGVLEDLIQRTICSVQRLPIRAELEAWPGLLGQNCLERLLGMPVSALDCIDVNTFVALRHRIDGQNIGGRSLRLKPHLPADVVLPSISRGARDRSPRQRRGPWLNVVDEESRFSLTPQSIADAQSALFQTSRVIDVFGGVGGNAVALAKRGIQVILLEPVYERVQMARRNLKGQGLDEWVEFLNGNLEDHLWTLLKKYPDVGLFIDPPWGGKNYQSEAMCWETLVAPYEGLSQCIQKASDVVLKLPIGFDLASLPKGTKDWSGRLEWVDEMRQPKLLTIWASSVDDWERT